MISGVLFVNAKGEVLVSRYYRDDVSKQATDAFRHQVVQAKEAAGGVPIVHLEGTSFLYSQQGDVYVVAATTKNLNATLVFQFMSKLVDLFKAYFGGVFDETNIRENFVLILELLDEVMDYGYPQITAVNLLKGFITVGDAKEEQKSDVVASDTITSEITGAVDWRQPGKFKYRKNEVYIDVLEAVNLLMSSKGAVLRSDVSGKIVMKAFLTGMPECKFGLNDKLVLEKEAKKGTKRRHGSGVVIDDLTFHRCVRLGQWDTDRTVSFIPPDGEFELCKYRITQAVTNPFRVIPLVTEHGRSRVEYEVKIKSNATSPATNVVLKIPCPRNTAKAKLTVTGGRAKYHPELSAIIWKIKKFPAEQAFTLKGEARLLASLNEKAWSRPPIAMEFQAGMFTASGLHVRFLKVFERNNYQTIKWVRYITRGGSYQIRI